MENRERLALRQLARSHGVQAGFVDVFGRRRVASTGALIEALRALGAPVAGPADAPAAVRDRQRRILERVLEPVQVFWDGRPRDIPVRLPAPGPAGPIRWTVRCEDGEQRSGTFRFRDLPVRDRVRRGRTVFLTGGFRPGGSWPSGYHRMVLQAGRRSWATLIVSAPRRAFGMAATPAEKGWGVFLPLHALRTRGDWGCGDFSDLAALIGWTQRHGGERVATLPLLAGFFDLPFEPSPYSPASRRFWNELFVDAGAAPELEICPEARRLLRSDRFRDELKRLRSSPRVRYRTVMALKRGILQLLADALLRGSSVRRDRLQEFIRARPEVEGYARFRAVLDRRRSPWTEWPQRLRDGSIHAGDFNPASFRLHLYVQWIATEQLERAARAGRDGDGSGLVLDFPIGVHPAGFDVWGERSVFATLASAGAPPDALFPDGQNWGFPPLHPERLREDGYRYLIACLRHQMKVAGMLRIDHVMGLHRLYWIPRGISKESGVYVRYPAGELYAIHSLESHRGKCMVVGEDLGTVPGYVRPAMERHGFHPLFVLQAETPAHAARPPGPVPASAVAGMNTHDMPPFAAFWAGADLEDRKKKGLLSAGDFRAEVAKRDRTRRSLRAFLRRRGWLSAGAAGRAEVLDACHAFLAASPARLLLVGLEDLWGETRQQNIPGSGSDAGHWRGRARWSLERFGRMQKILRRLRRIDRLRRGGKGRSGIGKGKRQG